MSAVERCRALDVITEEGVADGAFYLLHPQSHVRARMSGSLLDTANYLFFVWCKVHVV